MVHHLYVCNKDNEELNRHITFRNYLREHKEDRYRYSSIKNEMDRSVYLRKATCNFRYL